LAAKRVRDLTSQTKLEEVVGFLGSEKASRKR